METTNVNLVAQMSIFWQVDPFIKCSQCWFHQLQGRSQNCVIKKYLVLLSNHNVIGRNDLTGVKTNWYWYSLVVLRPLRNIQLGLVVWNGAHDILWLIGCFFICSPPLNNKGPISASHTFYPFSNSSSFLKKRQRKSEDLNSIQTALQIWDFQATPCEALCL